MNPASTYDSAPLAYMASDQVQRVLAIRGEAISAMILANRFLRARVNERLVWQLDPPPDVSNDQLARLYHWMLCASLERVAAFTRLLTVLVNHRAVMSTMDGGLLAQVIAWSGYEDVIDLAREPDLPVCEYFPTLVGVTLEKLEFYAMKLEGSLIGLLPDEYLQRMLLRFPMEAQPKIQHFIADNADQDRFLLLTLKAWDRFARTELADA